MNRFSRAEPRTARRPTSRLDEVAAPSRHAVAFGSAIVALKAQAKEDSHGPCSHRSRRQGIPNLHPPAVRTPTV